MLSLTVKQQYKLKRIQRKQKNRIKHKIICTLLITITIFSLILYSLPPITKPSPNQQYNYPLLNENILSSQSRKLLDNTSIHEDEEDYPEGYPPDLLNEVYLVYMITCCDFACHNIYTHMYRNKDKMEDGYYIS